MKIKKIIVFVLTLFISTSVFASTKITDMIGREVQINSGNYKRVVCIGAGALRMYSYVGDIDLLCGVEDIDNLSLKNRPKMFDSVARPYVIAYGDKFSKLDSCGVGGANAQVAEAEKILMCNPDIVISEYEDKDKEDALQAQLGVPVITLKTGVNGVFDDNFKNSMILLGKVFNKQKKADKINKFVESQIKEIKKRTSKVTEQPKVYICGLGNWGTTNHLFTSQDYIAFDICNVQNVVTGLTKKGVQQIEKEKFVELGKDMDIMIIDAAALKNIKPLYKENPDMFDSCKAWNEEKVYIQLAYNAYYTNYELALINAWFIAKSVYPDLFSDIDIKAKTDEVTKIFLDQELADKIFEIQTPGTLSKSILK